ncbi:hypothetical protein ABPG77_002996 [Micractinium sp. CCAP 211/92]
MGRDGSQHQQAQQAAAAGPASIPALAGLHGIPSSVNTGRHAGADADTADVPPAREVSSSRCRTSFFLLASTCSSSADRGSPACCFCLAALYCSLLASSGSASPLAERTGRAGRGSVICSALHMAGGKISKDEQLEVSQREDDAV